MPVPSVPTFTLTANATDSRIEVAVTNPGTNPDYNEVWRFTSGTAAIKITDSLAADDQFDDYAVASGVTYFYFVRAVNTDGFTDSVTASTSVTLSGTRIHVAAKNDDSNFNATYGVISLNLMAPVSRPSSREVRELIEPARSKPIIATGEIVDRSYSGTLIFAGFPNTDFTNFQTMYEARKVLCVRDVKRNILFGTMSRFITTYRHTFMQVELIVEESDFVEDLAA